MVVLKGFLDLSLVDWDGHTACVVFTPGCNFRCPFCYNRDLVLNPGRLPDVPLERVLSYLEHDGWGIDGVVITGGEPTLWPDLPELCRTFKELGFGVKLDTNGTNPGLLQRLLAYGLVDYVAMDIKAPLTPERYSVACGVDARPFLPRIKRSVELLAFSGVDYEFRTTVVPGLHRPGDIRSICQAIRGCKRFVIQSFKPLGPTIDPSFSSLKPFSQEELEAFLREAVEILGPGRVLLRP